MTGLRYGEIVFHNCLTRSWDQEVQYDESGTDLLFTRHRITVEGVAHLGNPGSSDQLGDQICWIGPVAAFFGDVDVLWGLLREELSRPRQSLQITIGDKTVLSVDPANAQAGSTGYRDADNGPKPKVLSFQRILGNTARIAWQVETAVPRACVEGLAAQHGGAVVLSNRWSIEERIDERFFTNRTIRGRLRLSHPVVPAEAARQLVVPPLEDGFRRDSIQFTVTTNGLDCEYEVTDQQVHTAAPPPAVRMDVTHAEVSKDGYNWITDFNIRLEGAPHVPKALLVTRAVQIVMDRMGWTKLVPPAGDEDHGEWIPQQIALIDHIGDENTIEFRLRLQRVVDEVESQFLAIRKNFGRPLELPNAAELSAGLAAYNPVTSPVPAIWGYNPHGGPRRPAAVMALACYLQDPCVNRHGYAVTGRAQQLPARTTQDRTEKTEVSGYETENLPEESPGEISRKARRVLYTRAAAETRYHEDTLQVGLPLGTTEESESADSSQRPTAHWTGLARGAQARVTIRWEIERIGSWPEMPEPIPTVTWKTDQGQIRLHLIRFDQDFMAPVLATDGERKVYAIEARMQYGLDRPVAAGESLKIEYLPTVKFEAKDRLVKRSQLYDSKLTP